MNSIKCVDASGNGENNMFVVLPNFYSGKQYTTQLLLLTILSMPRGPKLVRMASATAAKHKSLLSNTADIILGTSELI